MKSQADKVVPKLRVDKLLQDITIITMDEKGTVFENGAIAIQKNEIVECGPSKILKEKYTADEVVTGSHLVATPGLIDTHTHLPMSLFRGIADDLPLMDWLKGYIFPAEAEFVNHDFVKLGTELALLELTRGGVTSVADMYYFSDAIAETASRAGVRGIFGQAMADFASPDSPDWESNVARVKDHLEKFRGHELVTPGLAPHAPYTVSKKHLIEVAQISEDHKAPILIHVAEDISESQSIADQHGCSPVKYLAGLGILNPRTIAAHMVWPVESDFELLKSLGVGVAHCPESNLKLNAGIAPVEKMIQRGIAVAVATDGAASNNDLDLVAEMSLAAKLHKVANKDPQAFKANVAFSSVTSMAARVLKREKRVGQLSAGYLADITIFDFDKPHLNPVYDHISHLVYACKSSDVSHVMVNGQWTYKNGQFAKLDVDRIMAASRKFSEKVKSRLFRGKSQ